MALRVTAVVPKAGGKKAAGKALQGAGKVLGSVGKKIAASPSLPGKLPSPGPMAPKLAAPKKGART